MNKQINIEEKFQQAFDGFKVEPQASVWENIQSQIPSASAGSTLSAAAGKTSIIAKSIIGIAVISAVSLSVYFIGKEDDSKELPKVETEQLVPVQKVEKDPLTKGSATVTKEKSKPVEQEPKLMVPQEETGKAKIVPVSPSNTIPKELLEKDSEKDAVGEEITVVSTKNATIDEQEDVAVADSEVQIKAAEKQAAVDEKEQGAQEEVVSGSETDGSTEEPLSEEKVEIQNTIPNIFTPNQDGYNDVFRIETNEADQLEVSIYDKNGAKIFNWKGLYGFWDGKLPNGEMAPEGRYLYQVILKKDKNSTIKKGMVVLKK